MPEALPENSTMDFFIKWLLGHEEDELSSNPPLMPEKDEYKAVSFKITAKDFGTFDGKPEHWFPFKHKTESTLGVAGFSSLLDVHVPMSDVEGNRRLYYLLEGATNDGAASHIIKQHKVMKDGRAAWVALKDWYEGKTMAGDIAKTCRVKLQALELLPKGDANTYINEFIKLKDQLEEAGEGERPATLVEQFLDQIKDPQYEVTVSNLRMENDKTLDQCIEVIRKHDLVVTRQRIKDHRFSKIRRLNSLGNNPHNPSGSALLMSGQTLHQLKGRLLSKQERGKREMYPTIALLLMIRRQMPRKQGEQGRMPGLGKGRKTNARTQMDRERKFDRKAQPGIVRELVMCLRLGQVQTTSQ